MTINWIHKVLSMCLYYTIIMLIFNYYSSLSATGRHKPNIGNTWRVGITAA